MEKTSSQTLEEIRALAGLAFMSREINHHQERIIRGAPKLSALPLDRVMIPKEQVLCLPADVSTREGARLAADYAHTRFPVSESGRMDVILGYVNFKELARDSIAGESDKRVRDFLRPAHFFSSEASSAELLRRFVDERVRLAIVNDKEGHALGLVTLEDLIEELVGELEDEVDGRRPLRASVRASERRRTPK